MGVTVKIPPGALGPTLRAQAKQNIAAIERGIKVAKARGVAVLKQATPVDQGPTRAAWATTSTGIENSSPVVGIIERGARPHKTSREGIDAIREWVIRKGIVGLTQPMRGGHFGPERMRAYRPGADEGFDYLIEEVVWGIVKRLEKYGQEPTYFILNSLPKLAEILQEEVTRAIDKAMREEVQK